MESPSSRVPARSTSRGFTLIELLTVIAIIGILAAILIPTVSKVREQATASTCAANLRQIALAVITYTDDNRGYLPSSRNAAGQYTGLFRGVIGTGYLYDPNDPESAGRQLSGIINGYLKTGTNATTADRQDALFVCKSLRDRRIDASNRPVSYLINNQGETSPTFFFGSASASAGSPAASPKRLVEGALMSGTVSRVTAFSKLWMLSDSDSYNYSVTFPSVGSTNMVDYPHNGGRNYAFFTGHVEYRKADNIPANP
jgi:prepilin-type N-terminal cleavage/methylation domain-containing protein/prepilin-type processing-associated H-X9-DG protein